MPSPPWLAERRTFATSTRNGPGKPDGLTVDSEGGVWVALYAGGAVLRYDPSGALSEVIEVPVQLVTSCCFGGEDLSELYITTSRENLSPDEEPNAGSIFRVRTGVRGLPVQPFTG
jgi:sugar lactone lactonase YvrE